MKPSPYIIGVKQNMPIPKNSEVPNDRKKLVSPYSYISAALPTIIIAEEGRKYIRTFTTKNNNITNKNNTYFQLLKKKLIFIK